MIKALGNSSYDSYFSLINNILDGNSMGCIEDIDRLYDSGVDLKKFVDLFTDFCFDILKYILCQDIKSTKIPDYLLPELNKTVRMEEPVRYFNYIVDKLLLLKNMIKTDNDEKVTVEIVFNQISRFV